ncbi:MAG: hypothetical protein WC414_00965 [Patescibacteria group bacterium]
MKNNYQYTRSIGFNLKGGHIFKLALKDEGKISWNDLLISYNHLIQEFRNVVFWENNEGEEKINYKLEIKYLWLKQYARENFFSEGFDRTNKKYTAKEAKFLKEVFKDWIEKNEEFYKQTKIIFSRPEENQSKKSDMLEVVKILFSPDFFPFVRDFIKYANDKNNNKNLQQLKKTINTLEIFLEKALFILSPNQSNGVEVARASFNFYTINKTPKKFDEELEKKQKELDVPCYLSESKKETLVKVKFIEYLKEQNLILEEISKENLYEYLKKFKAQEKIKFLEMVNKKKWTEKDVYEYIKSTFILFVDKKENVDNFLDLTEKIINTGNEGKKEKQRELKIKRGRMFTFYFPDYKKYCDIYKELAMEVGRIKAEIRGIEQEKIDSCLLNFWAQILKIGDKKFLILIPKDKLEKIKRIINEGKVVKSDISFVSFNSLTLRALDKLIRKNFSEKIPEMNKSEENKIKQYQKVLKDNLNKIKNKIDLDLKEYDENKLKEISSTIFSDIEDFRLALEKITYTVKENFISKNCIDELIKNMVIFSKITSYDFERNLSGKMKDHSLVWNNFWDITNQENCFPVRLNPELRIMYRKKREQSIKRQNNRFSKESFRVNFTITENAIQKEMKFTFTKLEDIQQKIEEFNQKVIMDSFVKEKDKNLYYFGIDRGNQELATLGVVRWTKEEYEAMLNNGKVIKFQKPEFPEISVYKMKDPKIQKELIVDKNVKKKTLILSENPSYFMESEDEFNKNFLEKKVSFINLTTAKLIKGRIILDGDTKTYINLKKANAKRKLFDVFTKIDSESNVEFCDEFHEAWNIEDVFRNSFLIKSKDGERELYQILCYFFDEQKRILSLEDMKTDLQEYLENLRQNVTAKNISIKQINNLRDAITSNMVGIIAFLFDQYPAIINLENLHSVEEIHRHFSKNNENIARRLEWALYRKFQKIGLVPPNLKQTIFLKENEKKLLNQFGIIHFVKTEKTSGNCPFCGENVSLKQRQKDKFVEHVYICKNENCNFNTKLSKFPLEKIDNSDSVASYNIAKQGMQLISSKKWNNTFKSPN